MKLLQLLRETFFLKGIFSMFSGDEHHIISEKGRELVYEMSKECIMHTLDLNEHREKYDDGSYKRVFTSFKHGERIRDSLNFDFLESNSYNTIIIPPKTYSITPSFFEGLFGESIEKLGRDKFMEKFKFVSPDYDYEKNLNECISRIERMN